MKNAKILLTIPVAVALVCAAQANISKAARFQPSTNHSMVLDTVPKPDSPKKFVDYNTLDTVPDSPKRIVNYNISDTVPKPDSPKKIILF